MATGYIYEIFQSDVRGDDLYPRRKYLPYRSTFKLCMVVKDIPMKILHFNINPLDLNEIFAFQTQYDSQRCSFAVIAQLEN